MKNLNLNNILKISALLMCIYILLLATKFINNMEVGRYQNAGSEGYPRILDTKTGDFYLYNYEEGWHVEKIVEN